MRRMVKESLLKFDGRPLFPERIAYTVPYKLSTAEAQLYKQVTDYVREEFNRAEALEKIRRTLKTPLPERLWYLADGVRLGLTNDELFAITKIDPWFLEQVRELIQFEQMLAGRADQASEVLSGELLWEAKEQGFSDDRIGLLLGVEGAAVREARTGSGKSAKPVRAVTYKRVDTCAAPEVTVSAINPAAHLTDVHAADHAHAHHDIGFVQRAGERGPRGGRIVGDQR